MQVLTAHQLPVLELEPKNHFHPCSNAVVDKHDIICRNFKLITNMTMISIIAHVGQGFLYSIEQRMPFFSLTYTFMDEAYFYEAIYIYKLHVNYLLHLLLGGWGFLCINNENSYFQGWGFLYTNNENTYFQGESLLL